MAVNKPIGDNTRKGAVKKRSQFKSKLGGTTAWTKRNKKGCEFMAIKKPAKKTKAAKRACAGKNKSKRPQPGKLDASAGAARLQIN
jgi:hypothetical protein